jgi:hypothetical protein
LLHLLPLDLHVLGTPPAFNLSQDQTLHLKFLSSQVMSESKAHCWTFGHSVNDIQRTYRRESPHKLPAKFLKSTYDAKAVGKGREV